MTDDPLERAIASYRAELASSAQLTAADLDELEDHLRALLAALIADGWSPTAAFGEAIRRLGEPRAIADELVRARHRFATPLGGARVRVAAALIAAVVLQYVHEMHAADAAPIVVMSLAFGAGLVVMLACGRPWARAIGLGFGIYLVATMMIGVAMWSDDRALRVAHVVAGGAIVLCLAPARLDALTPAGWALVLIAAAYPAVAGFAGPQQAWPPVGVSLEVERVALAAITLGHTGVVLGARWSSVTLAVAAFASALVARQADDPAQTAITGLAVAALLAAAVLASRPRFGVPQASSS